jgi:hypothetical protein
MFGEFEEMVFYHALLIKIMLGILIVGVVIPFMSNECKIIIKRMRIYMFFSHGMITSVAFSGMVAFVFAKISFDISMGLMVVVYILISLFETIKYFKILKSAKRGHCHKEARGVAIRYGLLNITLLVLPIAYKIMEHKSAVPLS